MSASGHSRRFGRGSTTLPISEVGGVAALWSRRRPQLLRPRDRFLIGYQPSYQRGLKP